MSDGSIITDLKEIGPVVLLERDTDDAGKERITHKEFSCKAIVMKLFKKAGLPGEAAYILNKHDEVEGEFWGKTRTFKIVPLALWQSIKVRDEGIKLKDEHDTEVAPV